MFSASSKRHLRVVPTSPSGRSDGSLRSFRCFLSLVNYGTFERKVPSERSVDDVPLLGGVMPLYDIYPLKGVNV